MPTFPFQMKTYLFQNIQVYVPKNERCKCTNLMRRRENTGNVTATDRERHDC